MIGIKFNKPLEPDTMMRDVVRTVTREIEEQVPYTVEREHTYIVQEPVYESSTLEDGTQINVQVKTVDKEVTETIQDVEYRTEKRTVTEEVQEQEQYDNPAPNTYTRYREAAQWCNANGAVIVDRSPDSEHPEGFYEVVTLATFEAERLAKLSPEERAEQALAQAKAERAATVASITVEVDGMVFDGDETSQERMARTVTAATATGASMDDTTTWVLHDNTVAQVTIRQLATALRIAGEAQTALWTVPYTNNKNTIYTPSV